MFTEEFITALAKAIARELHQQVGNHQDPKRWPEVMNLETAAEYIDRTPDGLRHLIRKRDIPAVRADTRLYVRRVDLDRWAERHVI